jgi:hypothetical protein
MAGLVPAIHVFLTVSTKEDVDARDIWREDGASRLLPGHGVWRERRSCPGRAFARHFFVLPESFTASKVANSTL